MMTVMAVVITVWITVHTAWAVLMIIVWFSVQNAVIAPQTLVIKDPIAETAVVMAVLIAAHDV
jgi:hypothetical protein